MQDAFSAVGKKYGLTLIMRFGSTVKGTAGAMSDMDVLVHGPRELALGEEAALRADLASLLKVHEEHIDLVLLARANPQLAFETLWHGKLLWGSVEVLHEEQVRAWKRMLHDRKFARRRREFLERYVQHVPAHV